MSTNVSTQLLTDTTTRHWILRRRIGFKIHDLATAQIVPGGPKNYGLAQTLVTDVATCQMCNLFNELTIEDAAERLERLGFKPAVYVTVGDITELFTVGEHGSGVMLFDQGNYYAGNGGATLAEAIAEAEAMLTREAAAV